MFDAICGSVKLCIMKVITRPGSTPVSTVLRKSVRFFIRNLFLIIRTFQVEIWKMVWTNVFFFQFLEI